MSKKYTWWRIALRWLARDWWVPRRSIWPYRDGYATYNSGKNTVCDTGLTRERAVELCREMNYGTRP